MSVSYDANVIKLGKLWKGLGKFTYKVVVNGDTTLLGGNFAVNSIEQLGYVKEEGYTPVASVESEQYVYIFPYGDTQGTSILGQMYNYEKIGEWEEVERNSLPPDMQSLSLLAPAVSTDYGVIAFYDYDQDGTTKCWKTKNSQAYLKASFYNQFNVPSNIAGAIKVYDAGGFKPFFTEQQYQALLNLIK